MATVANPVNGLAIWLLAAFSGAVWGDPLPDQPYIYVQGTGTATTEPESATLDLTYSVGGETVELAERSLQSRLSELSDAGRSHGLTAEDISASSLAIGPETGYVEGDRVTTGFIASRKVRVTLDDLDVFAAFMQRVYATEPSSLNMRLHGGPDTGVLEAQQAALEDARARASALAASAGMRLSGVHSISEFAVREHELYRTRSDVRVGGQAHGGPAFTVQGAGRTVDEEFVPGAMETRARVYVVFLIESRQ